MTQFIENTNTNNTMSSYFSKAFTTFNEELSLPDNCVPFTGAKFGLLNLEAVTSGPSTIEHELILVIDNYRLMYKFQKKMVVFDTYMSLIIDLFLSEIRIFQNDTIYRYHLL